MRGVVRRVLSALVLALLCGGIASAHPLGNFTINHLSRLSAHGGTVRVHYVVDMAEIPTFALQRSLDVHGAPSHPALNAWARTHAERVAGALTLSADGRPVTLAAMGSSVTLRAGAGGLPTLYATADLQGTLPAGARALAYADGTEPNRIGWKDVVLETQREPTAELRAYPSALLGSPRERVAINARVLADGRLGPATDGSDAPAGGALPAAAAGLARSNALSELLARGAHDPRVVLGALLLAFALGALHAFEPGHGKTLLAVSLVGARATAPQALILAAALTIAHTAGVFALGLLTIFAARYIVPEAIYPWISLVSGALVAILGGRALAREIARRRPYAHVHGHAHDHAHPHDHAHVHASHEHHHDDDEAHARAHAIPGSAPLSFRAAVLAASSGNLAPCPAALVVLLAALQLHAVAYGMVLIVAFGLGLAGVLTALGFAVVHAGGWLARRPGLDRFARWAPLASAGAISVAGAVMVAQGFAAQGLGVSPLLVGALVLLAIAGYTFTAPNPHHSMHQHA